MKISQETNVGEVVRVNFKAARVFQENNIDYCCGGSKPISEACLDAGADTGHVISQLEEVLSNPDPDSDYMNNLGLGELCHYIVHRHHAYVHDSIPPIRTNLDKICRVHGDHHPELFEINELFIASAGNLVRHMQKEEIILFPFIERLEKASAEHAPMPEASFGSVLNPIKMMVEEHQAEGDRFDEIQRLSNGYRLPGDACATYEVTFKQLKEFEKDLHRHIHLENNILFPRAISLETVKY